MAKIRVEIESELATSKKPARVLIYQNEELVMEVVAKVEYKQGADLGLYPCVDLKKIVKLKMVVHHDDPPCYERLDSNGCPKCKVYPDSQSIRLYSYCPSCDVPLKELKCPSCKQTFQKPN
ncbi:MAG: hypothetical protein AAB885_02175 [Patescibacteria group bacterium]